MNQAMETPFRAIRQIGLVTGDLDRFIQNMENLYHLRPDRTAFVPVGATKETCLRRLAFYEFEHIELEVVEPLRSHPAWHIFLDRHGDCLQHIQFNVEDLAAAIEHLEQQGVEMIERGHSITVPEVEYVFFDTVDRLGYVTEIVNFKEIENRNARR